jgi:alkanesulfonate monooxygenase SsuD/methylene tetrahydromethanopterin reductase-like flavin-dependent oxidoreductase (luciferase family)
VTVCWDRDEAAARRTVKEIWPNAAIRGEASQELPSPKHFEQLAEMVTEEMLAEQVVCGPDVERHVEALQTYVDAGFDHVYVHQVGPDQQSFIDAYRTDVLPRLRTAPASVA